MDLILASRHSARCFYIQGRHIIIASGPKPAGSEVVLFESHPAVRLSLTGIASDLMVDTYYLVRPIFSPGPMLAHVRIHHRAGSDLLPVEPVACAGDCRTCPTGCSQSFRLDEAFADALRQLPMFAKADTSRPLPLVDLVAMGALYGGFSGFSRLFVRLRERTEP